MQYTYPWNVRNVKSDEMLGRGTEVGGGGGDKKRGANKSATERAISLEGLQVRKVVAAEAMMMRETRVDRKQTENGCEVAHATRL
jgi:hypothetical protein